MDTVSDKTILVVDDDARMVRALEKVLLGEGAAVIPAFEASEAVDILTKRHKKVDLVITDLRMPFINGVTLLYAIHEIFPAMPVIVLTAFGSPDVRAECLRHGAAAFLEKPLDSEHLLKKVKQVLSKETGADKSEEKKIAGRSPVEIENGGNSSNKERSRSL